MHKIFITLLLLGIALIVIRCQDDILESTPYGQSTSADFWRNGDDAVSAANAMYEPLLWEDFYGHAEHTFDIPSDDQWRAGDHGEDQAIEEFTFDADNAQLAFSWKPKYEIISRANAVLINVPDIEMDQTLKDRTLGEAHFMRAFMYWRLAVIYGGVPLILEEDVLEGNYNKPRATLEETQSLIESDWLRAAELLPLTHDEANVGRPTKGTAWGFLTKLYVYQEDFPSAIEYGTNVTEGPYGLAPSFENNFTIETENNPEMLFAVQGLDGWAGSPQNIYTTPRPWGGWDFHEPVDNLVEEFEEGDPRLDYSLFMPGEMVDLGGEDGLTEYTTDLSQTGYHFQKYASWRASGGLNDGQNVPILRSADVYLLVAEAKIRSGQSGDTELNAVRQRSGLSPITNATMEHIIHERRVELAGENQRHQDLIRWDKAGLVDIVAIYAEDRGQFDPPRNFQRPKHYLFAIPQREIDLSNGVLEQNSDY
ncbi:MAG: RagB/SusD family nutrient uptake outer membrane protein [Cyclobacteriaceae bacterium]